MTRTSLPARTGPGRRPPVPLVGREAELESLVKILEEAGRGAERVLGVRGEPGIGKSRLLQELSALAAGAGALVLAGRATELERDLPFALFADALEAPAAARADALSGMGGEALGELAAALPAFGRAAGAAPVAASGERHRVARAVRALLEWLARDRMVVLLLDDVQWADPVSEDVLALLVHRPPRARVLLALAMRSNRAPALEAALGATARSGAGTMLDLGPLARSAVEALLPDAGPAAQKRLYAQSGGNPFFLEELARTAPAGGAAAAGGLPGVPAAVRAALAGEVHALSAGARLLLESAAVAGDPFELELASAVAVLDEPAVFDALDELLAADLVRLTEDPRRFRFRHPLVLRAVYEGAAGGWKLAAHARANEALAARGARPGRRAHHVARAGRIGESAAIDSLVEAAYEVAAAAPATAAAWLEAAMRLLPGTSEHARRRLELLGAQGLALASAGRVLDAREVLRRLLALVPGEAAAERVAVAIALADLDALWTDQPAAARQMLEAERDRLGDTAPGPAAALTLALARERAGQGNQAAALVLAEDARAAARAVGDRVLEADAAVAAAAAQCSVRRHDSDGLVVVERCLAEADALVGALRDEQAAQRLTMVLWLGIARLFTGHLTAGYAVADRGLAIARATKQGVLAPAFIALRAFADQELGRLDAAETGAEEAVESAIISGNGLVAFFGSGVLSWTALMRGRPETALRHGEAMWQHLGASPYNQAGWTVADARLALGDPEGALAALEASGWVRHEMLTIDRVRGAEVAVRVSLALGRSDDAARWARHAAAESGGRRTGVFGAVVARAQAAVLLEQGAAADAARVALAGAAAGDDGPAPIWAGRCRIAAGKALAAAGNKAAARAELRQAASELEARGAWGDRDAALKALRRLGDRPRAGATVTPTTTPGDGPLSALTAREREVADLVGEGRTNAQIAARLQLSERTVEKHVSRTLAKLGVATRSGVVRLLAGGAPRAGAGATPGT